MNRYERQIKLEEVGVEGQNKISSSKVLIVGCGGLGNFVAPILAGAGVGNIGLIDNDTVIESNLHRQILFSEDDVNKFKTEALRKKLHKLNSTINIKAYEENLNRKNCNSIISDYILVIDCTDNIEARYTINDACIENKIPFVHAALFKHQVQLSVFNYKGGPNYRNAFPSPQRSTRDCSETGILGSTVAIAGSYLANEALKTILGSAGILNGKILIIDTLYNSQNTFEIPNSKTELNFKEDIFECTSITDTSGVLIDVRNTNEMPKIKSAIQVPLNDLDSKIDSLSRKDTLLVFCASGKRSKEAYRKFKESNFTSVYCLKETAQEIADYYD